MRMCVFNFVYPVMIFTGKSCTVTDPPGRIMCYYQHYIAQCFGKNFQGLCRQIHTLSHCTLTASNDLSQIVTIQCLFARKTTDRPYRFTEMLLCIFLKTFLIILSQQKCTFNTLEENFDLKTTFTTHFLQQNNTYIKIARDRSLNIKTT